MGRDLYERIPAAHCVFDLAAEVLGFDIARLCFEGPTEELNRTVNAQPCLLAVELAALVAVRGAGVEAGWAAGHSLGEFSAWVASGAVAVDVALRLVRRRGELMEQAAQRHPGGMAAILGLEEDKLAEICREVGAVVLANLNCPGQIVVSGETEAVAAVGERAQAAGGRAISLAVSGAFHSPLMAEANAAPERIAVAVSQLRTAKITPRGTLIRKMLRHPQSWVSAAPYNGPSTPPASAAAPMMPRVNARFSCGKTSPATAIAMGTTAPPPAACTIRAPTRLPRPPATRLRALPSMKMPMDTTYIKRRPRRSAIRPKRGIATV
jgi:malonyl CoA-acyl carrier protein transacylase